MRKTVFGLAAAASLLSGQIAAAEETLVGSVLNACKPEIERYCSNVTLGEGRLLACFYAHEDKLSNRCGHALYQAATTLEQVVAAFKYLASACEADINTHCANVDVGEGRIIGCLKSKSEAVSAGCNQALEDVIAE